MSARSMSARATCIAVIGLAGCRSEFLAGVQSSAGTGDGSSSGADATTTTTDGTSTTTESSSSSGPACDEPTLGTSEADTGEPPTCMAPMGHTVCDADTDPFHAIGLDCGGVDQATPILAPTITGDASTLAVGSRYGSDDNQRWVPTEGSKLLVLTTGMLDVVADRLEVPLGRTYADDGDNPNPDGELPVPIDPTSGIAPGPCAAAYVGCDLVGDCSDSLPPVWDAAGGVARDLAWLRFDVAVPFGTFGWRVDLAWFSAEYPEAHDEIGADTFVWWQTSERFTGNAATIDGAAMTVAGVGATIASAGFVGNAPELAGTGYESVEVAACETPWTSYPAGQCPNGGSTPWLTLLGPAHPGETMTMVVALFDAGDANVDTAVLLDNWRWDCDGCTPGTTCGVQTLATE
jgi:hypothetical protein